MRTVRQVIGGLGNLMFKQAFIVGQYLDGDIPETYVQDTKYWKRHENTIRKMFSDGIGYTDKVSIHIRRGDYVQAKDFHLDLSETNYYPKAIKQFPDDKFLVFCKDNQGTDESDREWCEKFMTYLLGPQGERWEFVPLTNTETEDMNLMASCKSNIIANSTYSWWAAWLNPNPDKKVVCPKQWFVDGEERISLPEEWIKI